MDEFYACIEEPSLKRRILLQSSKDLLSSLKILEGVFDLKQEKRELFSEMNLIFEELDVLNSKLNSKIPRSGMLMEQPEKTFKIPKIPELKKEKKSRVSPSRLDALERELAAIEGKLKTLE